jgi:hypothetical protein
MFGLPEALMSFIRRQVGLRTDTASASGSLHAKARDIKNEVVSSINAINTRQAPRSAKYMGSGSYNKIDEITLLNVSGRGTLLWLWMYRDADSPCGGVIITVDGVDILEGGGSMPRDTTAWFVPAADGELSVVTACAAPIMLDFASSLEIRTKPGISGTNPASIYWVYSKE